MNAITYCFSDEAAMLSAHSIFPILKSFMGRCDIDLHASDISLSSRILAAFSSRIGSQSIANGDLTGLVMLSSLGNANIIKPPCISASVTQLKTAILELRKKGYTLPAYPDSPQSVETHSVRRRYDQVLGSAVNVALRRGNTERRTADIVKRLVRTCPPSASTLAWSSASRSHVATMCEGDFRSTEQAVTVPTSCMVRVEHVGKTGGVTTLGSDVAVGAGDVVDCAVMRRDALEQFMHKQIESATSQSLVFSVELKCTTMRVSDPIILGVAVRAYYRAIFEAFPTSFCELDTTVGFASVPRVADLAPNRTEFDLLLKSITQHGPKLTMDSFTAGRPSIAISMANAIRNGGQTRDCSGKMSDTKFVIPDHTYASFYRTVIDDCIALGPFDQAKIGSVDVVGLTADSAEEYGSQDTTHEVHEPGYIRVVDDAGTVIASHAVAAGDLWRMCRSTHVGIEDWICSGIDRAQTTGEPVVFWLDQSRPRDRELNRKLEAPTAIAKSAGVEVYAMDVASATRFTLGRLRRGNNTVAATGNVLRDYVSELFACVEVGTSAWQRTTTKLPLNGTLFEVGAAGCAPRLFHDFLRTNHLRWNPIGEIIAITGSIEVATQHSQNRYAARLLQALVVAGQRVVEEGRLPSRRVGGLDTRGSHFYLAYYWAMALQADPITKHLFGALCDRLATERARIETELLDAQGAPVSIGGYYHPDPRTVSAVMRPCTAFNEALSNF